MPQALPKVAEAQLQQQSGFYLSVTIEGSSKEGSATRAHLSLTCQSISCPRPRQTASASAHPPIHGVEQALMQHTQMLRVHKSNCHMGTLKTSTGQRQRRRTKARYSFSTQPDPSSSDASSRSALGQVVDTCLNILQCGGKLDHLVGLFHSEELILDAMLPPSPQHDWMDRLNFEPSCSGDNCSSSAPPGPLEHILEAMQEHAPALHLMDSCAIRTLVLQRPKHIQKLSGLWQSPRRFMQRVLVEGPTGEEAVLTLTLVKQGSSASLEQHPAAADHPWDVRSRPSDVSASASSPGFWSVTSITGEALHPALPTTLSPEFGPEAVVKSQVDALRRGDLQVAYGLLSPGSQQKLGGLGKFMARMLSKRTPYCQLLGHSHASSVRRRHSGMDTYLELRMVEGPLGQGSGQGQVQLWCWVLKLQQGSEAALANQGDEGDLQVEDCWAIDSVVQVPAEAL